jgi:hypothetical protein
MDRQFRSQVAGSRMGMGLLPVPTPRLVRNNVMNINTFGGRAENKMCAMTRTAGDYWDHQTVSREAEETLWMSSPIVRAYINEAIGGEHKPRWPLEWFRDFGASAEDRSLYTVMVARPRRGWLGWLASLCYVLQPKLKYYWRYTLWPRVREFLAPA